MNKHINKSSQKKQTTNETTTHKQMGTPWKHKNNNYNTIKLKLI